MASWKKSPLPRQDKPTKFAEKTANSGKTVQGDFGFTEIGE